MSSGPVSRRSLLAGGTVAIAAGVGVARPELEGSGGRPHSIRYLSRGTDHDINAAIADSSPRGAVVLGEGPFSLSAPVMLPHWPLTLVGVGRSVTVLRVADEAGCSAILTTDPERPNRGLTLQSFSVDGNRANQRAHADLYGIALGYCPDLTLVDLEVSNVSGHGLMHSGVQTALTEDQWWHRLYSHDNDGIGLRNSLRTRKVHYSGIVVERNGIEGAFLDHSECLVDGLLAAQNHGHGVVINNVYRSTYTNISATDNHLDGIHVIGMVSSMGSSWRAQNNGSVKGSDIFFSGDSSQTYGTTRGSVISGLWAGADLTPIGATVSEGYAVYIEDGVTNDVQLLDVHLGVSRQRGGIRIPNPPGTLRIRHAGTP